MITLDKTATAMADAKSDNGRLPTDSGNFLCGRHGASWHVVWTKPGQQHVADRELRAAGFPTFFPLYGARRAAYVPMFGRYGFVQPNDDGQWVGMLHTRGGAGVIRSPHGTPKIVPERNMAELFAQCAPNGVIFEPAPKRLVEGEVGKILEGPFVGFMAICKWTSAERVGMLLTIMGRETTFEYKHEAVEAATVGVTVP
jgi:transcription antitermination factor NusG